MVEAYIVLAEDTIQQVYETGDEIQGAEASMGNEGLVGALIKVPFPFEGLCGQKKAEFNPNWKLRPLKDRVAEGLVTIPPAETVDEETGVLRRKTLKELIDTGVRVLESYEKYVDNEVVIKSWEERIAEKIASYEEWLSQVVRPHRNYLLTETDSVYCNPERWWGYSDEQKADWSAYKQALRDFPSESLNVVDYPTQLPWPRRPA